MEPYKLTKGRDDEEELTKSEITAFRSILGAALWLCVTRVDLIADVAMLQQEVSKPLVKHMKAANNIITRARKYREGVGLHYRPLKMPLKLVVFGDAASNTKHTNYYREGCAVILMHDDAPHPDSDAGRQVKLQFTNKDCDRFGGCGHLLATFGRKAKRVAWSTSQGETLAAVGAEELGQLVAARLTEVFFGHPISLGTMIHHWTHGLFFTPIDHVTDCKDMFELCTGEKGLPQDKAHRLYVAAIREMRLTGRIRRFILIPTKSMLADGFTKSMYSPQLLEVLSTGILRVYNGETHFIDSRILLHRKRECSDADIVNICDALGGYLSEGGVRDRDYYIGD